MTFLRPAPHVTAKIFWMDPRLGRFSLYAGISDPGGSGWRYAGRVVPRMRPSLAVAFNSGFRLASSAGGFYAYRRYAAPLRRGAASAVILKNGSMTVGAWGSGSLTMGSDISAVRQTLTLMIAGGRIARSVYGSWEYWGATLLPGPAAWRTGLGVTASGALVYVGGDGLTPVMLAKTLLRAGCLRAMELDMNPEWPAFNVYTPASNIPLRIAPHQLLANPLDSPLRYIGSPYSRDFFVMTVR
jgi:hypothetical protein